MKVDLSFSFFIFLPLFQRVIILLSLYYLYPRRRRLLYLVDAALLGVVFPSLKYTKDGQHLCRRQFYIVEGLR